MKHNSQINELTEYDIWGLKMAVMISSNENLQCSKCTLKSDQKYRDIYRGCSGFKDPKRLSKDEPWFHSKCLGNFNNAGFNSVIDLYYKYKEGILVESGGFFNQSAKYLTAINFVGSLITTVELQRIEALKKSSRGNRNGR